MVKQVTLEKTVSLKGVGLHSGATAEVILHPAKAGKGVVFKGQGMQLKLGVEATKGLVMSTRVEDERGNGVYTVEHLMSALHGLGVDNVVIEVEGPEVPIADGSALPWVELIDAAGRVELEKERNWVKVEKPVIWEGDGRMLSAEVEPRAGLWIECHVELPHPAIGKH
jgi:UDP-3-O-[3-hydroxymyristoyl] N-acetylglucosamine deacetylase